MGRVGTRILKCQKLVNFDDIQTSKFCRRKHSVTFKYQEWSNFTFKCHKHIPKDSLTF